jgi:hypothetical protein
MTIAIRALHNPVDVLLKPDFVDGAPPNALPGGESNTNNTGGRNVDNMTVKD